jgi:CRP/FNR family transcriptional regulator, cyclic AMP receptor protein
VEFASAWLSPVEARAPKHLSAGRAHSPAADGKPYLTPPKRPNALVFRAEFQACFEQAFETGCCDGLPRAQLRLQQWLCCRYPKCGRRACSKLNIGRAFRTLCRIAMTLSLLCTIWYACACTGAISLAGPKKTGTFDPQVFLATLNGGKTITNYRKSETIFEQGERAEAVFYIRKGKLKIVTTSRQGKEAVVGILDEGGFFGEGCLIGQSHRLASAVAMTDCTVMRLPKTEMVKILHKESSFAELFTAHLLTRNSRIEEDLVDQLFNSSEKRLARILLLLANFGKPGQPEPIVTKISQETLAEMVGTTRPRVSFFMNKFRKLGFIEYNGKLSVHSSLLIVVLRD